VPILLFLLFGAVAIAGMILWIWMLIDCATQRTVGGK
jgi:hypothetical protein